MCQEEKYICTKINRVDHYNIIASLKSVMEVSLEDKFTHVDVAMNSTFGHVLHLEGDVTASMNIYLESGERLDWLKYPERKVVKEYGMWKDLQDPQKWMSTHTCILMKLGRLNT